MMIMDVKKDQRSTGDDNTKIFLTPDSTLQTPSESRQDRQQDVRNDDSISVSQDDLHDPNTDRENMNDRNTGEEE